MANTRNEREHLGLAAEPQVVLRRPDEARGQTAERVRERGPLRHRGERHPRERHADDDAEDGRDAPSTAS